MATKPAAIGSATLEGALLELLMAAQNLETTAANNPDNRNFITGTYNSDTKTYSGTFSFPCSLTLAADGKIQIEATPYLVD